jgi:hypothetical protein
MMLAILIAVYLGALVFDLRPRLKTAPKGEVALYIALLVVSFSLLTMSELGVKVPSPSPPIKQVIQSIFHIQ